MMVSSRSEPVEMIAAGTPDACFEERDIAARVLGQIGEAADALGRRVPAGQRLVDRLARGQLREIARQLA